MKRAGVFVAGFLTAILILAAISLAAEAVGLVWLAGLLAKTAALVGIGTGVAAVKVLAPGVEKPKLSEHEVAEIEAFRRAEAWRNRDAG